MFASALLVNRMNSGLLAEEDAPLGRAIKFAKSKLILQRTVMARQIVEIAHEVGYDDFVVHLLPLVKEYLIIDPEPEVRSGVISNFGPLTGFLIQGDTDKGYELVLAELLPMLHHVLSLDSSIFVKSVACEALVTVTPHIRPSDRSDVVLPTVLSLAHDPDESSCRCLAVSLLSGLAESLGVELCTQFVVPQLCCLSEDPLAEVRTAAALSFVDICHVVGPLISCARLLSPFCRLSCDSEWPVRRAFLESLVGVSQSIPPIKACECFTNIIRRCLSDPHRLVKLSAQRTLGPFLSSLMVPELIPHDLVDEYLALASLEPEESARLSFSDRGKPVADLLALHSAASLLSRSTPLSNTTTSDDVSVLPPQECSMLDPIGASDPAALCAYSMAAVLWTLCGRGLRLFDVGKLPSSRARLRSGCVLEHPLSSTYVNYEGRDANKDNISSVNVDLGGFESCASMGGIEYWWPMFRPAFLTLLNKKGANSAVNIRRPLAASFPLIASLVLEDLCSKEAPIYPSLTISLGSLSSISSSSDIEQNDSEKDSAPEIRLKNEPIGSRIPPETECVTFELIEEPFEGKLETVNDKLYHGSLDNKNFDDCSPNAEACREVESINLSDADKLNFRPQSVLNNLSRWGEDGSVKNDQWKFFKSKRIRGTRSRPENLQDVEGICDRLLTDESPPVRVSDNKTAMVSQMPEVLKFCPMSARHVYTEKLLQILLNNSPFENPSFSEQTGSEQEVSVSHQNQVPQQPPASLITRLRFFSFGGNNSTQTQQPRLENPDFMPRRLRECWRLRHAVAVNLPKYLDLFDDPEDLRRLVLPIFLQLARDTAATVRLAVCASGAAVLSKLCPILTLYFTHGGNVDCAFTTRKDLMTIQQRAVNVEIPKAVILSLSLPVQHSLEKFLLCKDNNNFQTDSEKTYLNKTSNDETIIMTPPTFLGGPEVEVVKAILGSLAASTQHQDRQVYIRFCDAVVRGCPKSFFQLYFLRPLVRLSGDKVRNVRWLWASLMRAHVHKAGRLGDNALMITAVGSLISSCSNASASSFQLPLQCGTSGTGGSALKRTSSASSIDLLIERTGGRPRSASLYSSSEGTTTATASHETGGDSASPLSPRAPPGFLVDSSFVGTDAEIRRHLGTIVLASGNEASWSDGLDLEDLFPNQQPLNDQQYSPAKLSSQSFNSSSDPLSQKKCSPHNLSVSNTATSYEENSGLPLPRDGITPSIHQLSSPRLHFLIAEPRPVARRPSIDVVGVPGMHVDELDE